MTRPAPSLPDLTPKQRDVLALVADNRTSKEIAVRLGISESAVNQRIEMVRSRLGGLPRGELARLYRQDLTSDDEADRPADLTWQKIHLPESPKPGKEDVAESISSLPPGQHATADGEAGDGSQLSALFFAEDDGWLRRWGGATTFAQIAAIVAAAMLIAFGVTQLLGPVGGGQ